MGIIQIPSHSLSLRLPYGVMRTSSFSQSAKRIVVELVSTIFKIPMANAINP